ncbi:MAG: pilus assembly protein [Chloroflexota bacterium]|nr:pilus assembly protein [Chloroflexota bacterium]
MAILAPSADERPATRAPQGLRRSGRPDRSGQAIVEFALVIPIVMVLLTAIIEFAFLFNATLSSSYATRDASLVAAEAGNVVGADCLILQKIEQDFTPPSDARAIQLAEIYWSGTNGQPNGGAINVYNRTGSTTCIVNGLSITVPYTAASLGYPDSVRCNILTGCGGSHPNLDLIGVRVTYQHTWHTPLKSLLGFSGTGWTIVRSNTMRMEPVL